MNASRSESGFALLAVMLALIVVGGLVYTTAARTNLLARGTILDRGKMLTYHAASGGLAKARHALRNDPNYRGEELVIGSCHVKIESTPMVADTGKRWQVVVTASHQSFGSKTAPVQHRIEVLMAATDGLPTVLALHDSDG